MGVIGSLCWLPHQIMKLCPISYDLPADWPGEDSVIQSTPGNLGSDQMQVDSWPWKKCLRELQTIGLAGFSPHLTYITFRPLG